MEKTTLEFDFRPCHLTLTVLASTDMERILTSRGLGHPIVAWPPFRNRVMGCRSFARGTEGANDGGRLRG
jgi:hypothetical protein